MHFSSAGELQYVPPNVAGVPSDYQAYVQMSEELSRLIGAAAKIRDQLTEERKKRKQA
jgi:hypothetical protein